MLAFEAEALRDDTPRDVEEVLNDIRAMNHGLQRLSELPLSLRLLREIHAELMRDVRGGDKSPGEFRVSQNWIGGRVGRLLITLMLCEDGALTRPLLYLSLYLKARRAEYCDRLTAIREQGHCEAWVAFFLRGVSSTARAATQTAKDIVSLRSAHQDVVARQAKALALIDHLLRQPTVSIKRVSALLGCTAPTATKLVREFEARGWLRELTGYGRNRLWRYQPYVDLFHRDTLDALAVPKSPEAPNT